MSLTASHRSRSSSSRPGTGIGRKSPAAIAACGRRGRGRGERGASRTRTPAPPRASRRPRRGRAAGARRRDRRPPERLGVEDVEVAAPIGRLLAQRQPQAAVLPPVDHDRRAEVWSSRPRWAARLRHVGRRRLRGRRTWIRLVVDPPAGTKRNSAPESPFICSRIGSVSGNVLRGSVERVGDGPLLFRESALGVPRPRHRRPRRRRRVADQQERERQQQAIAKRQAHGYSLAARLMHRPSPTCRCLMRWILTSLTRRWLSFPAVCPRPTRRTSSSSSPTIRASATSAHTAIRSSRRRSSTRSPSRVGRG